MPSSREPARQRRDLMCAKFYGISKPVVFTLAPCYSSQAGAAGTSGTILGFTSTPVWLRRPHCLRSTCFIPGLCYTTCTVLHINLLEPKKRCSRCRARKPLVRFYRDRTRPDGHSCYCNPCDALGTKEQAHRRKAKDPEAYTAARRAYELDYYYGLSEEEYQRQYAKQGGVCAICGQNPEGRLAVDHDHITGRFRGLLCRTCNRGIGWLKDSIVLLEAAIVYLRNQEDPNEQGIENGPSQRG